MSVNINSRNSVINSGEINGPVIIGSDSSNEIDYEKFSKLLNDVIINSNDRTERTYALEAKEYADEEEHNKLRQLISNNFAAFTSGTFATLAGGVLLEMVKKLAGG
ncbi:MAG: hypothetical protein NC120_11265 [Ruminococcus sp.]|nr:hypothetical protein [Ruminococcus sp.]